MRSPYSPIQLATSLSHEQLKMAHQILGRIVFFFFLLHGAFYMYFFVQSGFLAKRIKDADVIFGICGFLLFSIISITALEQVRGRSYRFFLQCHIAIAVLVPPVVVSSALPTGPNTSDGAMARPTTRIGHGRGTPTRILTPTLLRVGDSHDRPGGRAGPTERPPDPSRTIPRHPQ